MRQDGMNHPMTNIVFFRCVFTLSVIISTSSVRVACNSLEADTDDYKQQWKQLGCIGRSCLCFYLAHICLRLPHYPTDVQTLPTPFVSKVPQENLERRLYHFVPLLERRCKLILAAITRHSPRLPLAVLGKAVMEDAPSTLPRNHFKHPLADAFIINWPRVIQHAQSGLS